MILNDPSRAKWLIQTPFYQCKKNHLLVYRFYRLYYIKTMVLKDDISTTVYYVVVHGSPTQTAILIISRFTEI